MGKTNKLILLLIFFFIIIFSTFSYAGYAKLAWDEPEGGNTSGYNIYYGTISGIYPYKIDVGNVLTYRLDGLTDTYTYYFAATAYNEFGESSYSNEVNKYMAVDPPPVDPPPVDDGGNNGGGGGCFIATAAYGSYLEPEVMYLREFRDVYLLKNSFGRKFVSYYYEHSPPLANLIARYELLRFLTRMALTPLVYSIKYPYVVLAVVVAIIPLSIVAYRRRKTYIGV